jgi:hypothetical protein
MANIMATDPGYDAAEVTPSDTAHLGNVRALYVGVGGDVKIDTEGGSTVTFVGVLPGSIIPVRAVRVYATGTDATDIVAIY